MSNVGTFGRRQAPPSAAAPRPRTWAAPPVAVAATPVAEDEDRSGFSLRAFLSHIPFVSIGLLLLLVGVYWVQNLTALEPPTKNELSYRSVTAMGAVSAKLVFQDGQWWRMLTAPLMHGSVAHIVGNGVTLLLVGWRLENLIGRRWFAAIFALSAIGGSLASTLMRSNGAVSVGASGAIMGLLAAAVVCSLHCEAHSYGLKMRRRALFLAIPALIPTSAGIDYSGHLGGAIAGVVIGFLLQIFWPENQRRPGHAGVALGITGGWAIASALVWIPIAHHYPYYVARNAPLIPDGKLPKNMLDESSEGIRIAHSYPDDPRSHLIQALTHLKQRNPRAAEQELRIGLSQTDKLANDMAPGVKFQLETALAISLLADGRKEEARQAAASACALPPSEIALKGLREIVRKADLCG